jgi:hypothetical protein
MPCVCAEEADEMQGRGRAHSQSAMSKPDDDADRGFLKQMPALLVEHHPESPLLKAVR